MPQPFLLPPEMSPNPLAVQELVDHCVDFLRDSNPDLKACALVSRSWVHPAQSRLFRKFSTEDLWAPFLEALEASPHLIRHVRHLHIDLFLYTVDISTLSQICSFPFTHIDSVDIEIRSLSEPIVMPLQKLLGFPTLRSAEVYCTTLSAEFAQLWGQSSVRDVELSCLVGTNEANTLPLQGTPPALESLWISGDEAALAYCIMRKPTPFDLSHLKVLKVGNNRDFPWQSFAQMVGTIESLHCVAHVRVSISNPITFTFTQDPLAPVHLSMFPRLSHLRVRLDYTSKSPILLNLLAGVTRSTRLRTITLSISSLIVHGIPAGEVLVTSAEEVYDQIDSVISTLPMYDLPSVELEQDPAEYDQIIPYFPRMSSKNLVCHLRSVLFPQFTRPW
ncbi:hypothetical protein B0H19DRAFT_1271924 [Mycena capillaripes]|nr:hypothetical protein B0H19DRAFT_1271924 [Mycena capillaripes]